MIMLPSDDRTKNRCRAVVITHALPGRCREAADNAPLPFRTIADDRGGAANEKTIVVHDAPKESHLRQRGSAGGRRGCWSVHAVVIGLQDIHHLRAAELARHRLALGEHLAQARS